MRGKPWRGQREYFSFSPVESCAASIIYLGIFRLKTTVAKEEFTSISLAKHTLAKYAYFFPLAVTSNTESSLQVTNYNFVDDCLSAQLIP